MALSERVFNDFLQGSRSVFGGQQAQGNLDLGTAGDLFRTLTMGDRTALARAAGPMTNQIMQSLDASKRQDVMTGNRTGGKLAGEATAEDKARQGIAGNIMGQQVGAASQLSQIGEAELQNMLQALNIGTAAAQKDVESRRQASAALWGSLIGAGSDILGAGIGAGWFKKAA